MANRVARHQFDQLNGTCAAIALNTLRRGVVSASFSLSSMGGARKRQQRLAAVLFVFVFVFFLVCSLIFLPAGHLPVRYLLPLRVVLVRETVVTFSVLFCPYNRYLFLFSTYSSSGYGLRENVQEKGELACHTQNRFKRDFGIFLRDYLKSNPWKSHEASTHINTHAAADTMPCAAGKRCTQPDDTPGPPRFTTHQCRGACGQYLHGNCGVVDPQG